MSEEELKATVIAGVPLRQYVAVTAAVGEGFPLETVLQHEALDPAAWGAIDKAWADALVESADTDLALMEAHDALLLEAQDRFWRAIPPLSGPEGLEPWLDFFRGVGANDDPFALLASLKMRSSDLVRLHRHWSDRIALEPPLKQEALRILGRDPRPLPVVDPEPVKLPPPVGGAPKAALPPNDSTKTSAEAPNGAPESPPLLAALPAPPSTTSVPPRDAPPKSVAPVPSRRGASAPVQSSAPPPQLQGAKLGLISYASACAEVAVHPDRTVAAWAKYGLAGAAIEAEHAAWRVQLQKFPEERAEFEQHFEQFKGHWRTQRP